MVYDSFAKEMVLEPTGIVKAKKPVRQDKAEGMKRVELHLHTNMSAMDGMSSTCLLYTYTMFQRGVAVRVLGDLSPLPEDIRAQIREVDGIADRLGPDAATASLCINYGGRDEIKNAVRAIAREVQAGALAPGDITEQTIGAHLYTAHMPDPDLIIRPSGEVRTSNFLLWQSAYSEYYFTDVLWPDFKTADMDAAINAFNKRNRRFGGV